MKRSRAVLTALIGATLCLLPDGRSPHADSWEYSDSLPEVLMCFPLPDRSTQASGVAGAATMARVLIGEDGYVRQAAFEGVAPADSATVASALRRWIFRPAQAPDSTGTFRNITVWVRIPFSKMRGAWCGGRQFAPIAARPDSLLRSRLQMAPTAMALRLRPPTASNFDSLRARLEFVDVFAGSLVAESRVADPMVHGTAVLAAIDLALNSGTSDSLATGCLPEPDYALRFGTNPNGSGGTDVLVSLRCDFVQVRSPEATLLVPARRVRDRLVALEAALFPSPVAPTKQH